MKKVDLLNAVVAETGMKPADVRKVMDATLNAMKKSLESGVDVAASPLGRLRVINLGEGETARTIYRIALAGARPPAAAATEALAMPATPAKEAKKSGWFGGAR